MMKNRFSVAALSIVLCTTMIGAAFATAVVKPESAKPTGKLVAVAKPAKAEFMKRHHHKSSSIKTSANKKK